MDYIKSGMKLFRYASYLTVAWNGINTAKRTIDTVQFARKCYNFVKKKFTTRKMPARNDWVVLKEPGSQKVSKGALAEKI